MRNITILIVSFINIFLLSCQNRETIVDKEKLLGFDIRLYQNTEAWELAKAVDDEDTEKIREEVVVKKVNINYKEEKFGKTLLQIAIWKSKYKSTKILLELGANPNLGDSYTGTTPLIEAAKNENPKFLELLLEHKGNPNAAENAPKIEGNNLRYTALVSAIGWNDDYSLEKVKMLVAAGADVNFDNKKRIEKPLNAAITYNKFDVALYLMQHGADYKNYKYTTFDGNEVYILKALRRSIVALDSKVHKEKIQVIAFLKEKGLDYEKEPIDDWALDDIKRQYPDSWKTYIEKY